MASRRSREVFVVWFGVLLSGCALLAPAEVALRYRVSAVISAFGSEYHSSQVWEMKASERAGPGVHFFQTSVRGEALPFQLPQGAVAFLLRRSRGNSTQGYGDFPQQCFDESLSTVDAFNAFHGPCVIVEGLPVLVLSTQPDVPASFKVVEPLASGPKSCREVCIVSVSVERTDEPVSSGLVRILPWLEALSPDANILSGLVKDAVPIERGYLPHLYAQDFSTEVSARVSDQ